MEAATSIRAGVGKGGGDLSPFDSAIMFGSKAFWNTIV